MKRRIFLSIIAVILIMCSLSGCKDKKNKESADDGSSTQNTGGDSDTSGAFGYGMADPGKIYEAGQCIQLGGSPLFIVIENGNDWLDSSKGLGSDEKFISVPVRYLDYEGSGDSLPEPGHFYITKASDENGNDLISDSRLQAVTDMSDSDIESNAETYYGSSVAFVPNNGESMDVWALFKVPEDTRECVVEVFLNDDFRGPHSAGYRIKIEEDENYGTFEGKSAEELSKMLSTNEKPTLDDFAWFTGAIREYEEYYPFQYRDADYKADNYLGGWKAYMLHDPENEKGEFEAHLANITIDDFEEEEGEDREQGWFDIRVKWYLGFDAKGNVIDESDREDLVIKRSYFTWNRMNNEEGDGYPDVSFAPSYGVHTAFGRGPMDMDSKFQYLLLVVRPDGTALNVNNEPLEFMPGSKTVRVPESMAANIKSSGEGRNNDGDVSEDGDEDNNSKPHFGPAAAAREKEKNGGEDNAEDEDDDSFEGRGPAQYGRERDEWSNSYHEPTEDDYINWDTSGDEKYYSGKKGYVISGSDTELLSKDSLKKLSDEDLRLAINEIYARHGRKFKSADLQKFFDNKSWYTPKYEPDEFDKKQNEILNDIEKKNLKILTEIRSERGKN